MGKIVNFLRDLFQDALATNILADSDFINATKSREIVRRQHVIQTLHKYKE